MRLDSKKFLSIARNLKIPSFLSGQQSSIGLDIGSSSIKLLELEVKAKERQIKCFAIAELTPGADIVGALKTLIESEKISGRQVNTSLSGQSVIMRYITLPRMAANELKSTMQFEAGQYIPFPIDEVVLDCTIVKEKIENNKMLVVLAAVKKPVIQERISLLEKAGLTVRVIDVDCFCLSNAFNYSYQRRPEAAGSAKPDVIGLLNIGANSTNMVIVDSGTLRFSRDIAFGGSEGTLNSLSAEISSSIDYYENQSGKHIEKVYLSGGSADSSAIVNFLNHQLGTAVTAYDFFTGLSLGPGINTEDLKTKGNYFAIALGLALR